MSERRWDKRNELFHGRYWGIFNVEGEDQEPLMMFRSKEDAERELKRRQAFDEENDDKLTEYHQVFRADLIGVWWNAYDPDPQTHPLMPETIIDQYQSQRS